MRFIDLFAGVGGFHVALRRLGHECVFASELVLGLQELYARNFDLQAEGDIRAVRLSSIPPHDILCAGFPCQPFSKAGSQEGLKCPRYGDLFDYVIKILRAREPKYLILENVPNLAKHAMGATWRQMGNRLKRAGYKIAERHFSPHQFGIPQIRDRIYIVGSRDGLVGLKWPEPSPNANMSIVDALEDHPKDAKRLPEYVVNCLNVWQQFIELFPKDRELPSFPILSSEFGATYPYIMDTPHAVGTRRLCRNRGSHGCHLRDFAPSERMGQLPAYARTAEARFPEWKVQFIRQNRELYRENKKWIDQWLPKSLEFPPCL